MPAAVTALMSGEGYLQSARNAAATGTFAGFEVNRQPMLRVLNKHRSQAYKISPSHVPLDLLTAAREAWDQTCAEAEKFGVKNSQISVLAPTGTIAFMMDCDTTGVEPDIALVKYKKLVGGGLLKIVNNTVPRALKRLGYDVKQIQEIVEYIEEHDTIEGAPHLRTKICRCSTAPSKPANGSRTIHYMGHVQDDGRGAAVYLRRDLQDHQHAHRCDGRRHHAGLHGVVEAGAQGGGDLPRRLQAHPAAQHVEGQREKEEQCSRRQRSARAAAQAARRAPLDHA